MSDSAEEKLREKGHVSVLATQVSSVCVSLLIYHSEYTKFWYDQIKRVKKANKVQSFIML